MNGLEVLDDEDDEEMRKIAMDLIKKSALSASARLQFCRLAFGASGSLGAAIDVSDAENVARGLLANDRTTLQWNVPRRLAPKNAVKLLLNLCLVAASAVPRGGVIFVDLEGEGSETAMQSRGAGRQRQAAARRSQFLLRRFRRSDRRTFHSTLLCGSAGRGLRPDDQSHGGP